MTGASPAERLSEVEAAMAKAARSSGRDSNGVILVAISKSQAVAEIIPLIHAGQRVFGENRVQEAQAKWPALIQAHPGIELHLVGRLQSNKAEDAIALFDVIHCIDRPSLVSAVAAAMAKLGRRPSCFIQVNIGDEPQKGGCSTAALPELLERSRLAGLPVAGLMAVPPADVEAAPYFALLAKLARRHRLPSLSMGMSADFSTAITLGATHIRVGTALFGERG